MSRDDHVLTYGGRLRGGAKKGLSASEVFNTPPRTQLNPLGKGRVEANLLLKGEPVSFEYYLGTTPGRTRHCNFIRMLSEDVMEAYDEDKKEPRQFKLSHTGRASYPSRAQEPAVEFYIGDGNAIMDPPIRPEQSPRGTAVRFPPESLVDGMTAARARAQAALHGYQGKRPTPKAAGDEARTCASWQLVCSDLPRESAACEPGETPGSSSQAMLALENDRTAVPGPTVQRTCEYFTGTAMFPVFEQAFRGATSSLDGFVYCIDHLMLSGIIAGLAREGVHVRLILDSKNFNYSSCVRQAPTVKLLYEAGVIMKTLHPGGTGFASQHSKTWVIDKAFILTGSPNLTENGFNHNAEHVFKISDSATVGELSAAFEEWWNLERCRDVADSDIARMYKTWLNRKDKDQAGNDDSVRRTTTGRFTAT